MIWNKLAQHHEATKGNSILSLFDGKRPEDYSVRSDTMMLDYSKTNIDDVARSLLIELATSTGLLDRREAMFSGQKINVTENRAVLHTALRNSETTPIFEDGQDIMPNIHDTLARMAQFSNGIISGTITTPAGKKFTDVVNIGIGGSDLGPAMAYLALAPYHIGPKCHFVSNVDGAHIRDTLRKLDPATTLVLVASKTFTTIETMSNAETARGWLCAAVGDENSGCHMAAVSSAEENTAAWGISADRVFGFEDWVGGRYSIWGPIGLSLMLAIGSDKFQDFLAGAKSMDTHFREADLQSNMPVMLALTGIWNNQICGHATRAVLPYDQRLSRLPAYFQQLEMESNGKRVSTVGKDLYRNSGPIVWGEPGTNGQHAFYQLIHQGTRTVPCEFMIAAQGHEPDLTHQHRLLIANCLAQSKALMRGRTLEEARELMAAKDLTGDEMDRQARHRVFPGNRPSTTLLYPKLTPNTLGQIIALYEHRVFVEGVILGINSFDQWGVELGKELAVALEPVVSGKADDSGLDGSTQMLIKFLRS